MANYVQYLNVGYGVFCNTKEVKKWDIYEAVNDAILIENPTMDIRIVGFRFYEKKDEKIVKKSGVYYLQGEIVREPQKDDEIKLYFDKLRKEIPKCPVVKLMKPYFLIYPYTEGDTVIKIDEMISKEELRKKREEVTRLRIQVESYKDKMVTELYRLAEAIEKEEFSNIRLEKMEGHEKVYLDLLQNQKNIGQHIEQLMNDIKKIEDVENSMKARLREVKGIY